MIFLAIGFIGYIAGLVTMLILYPIFEDMQKRGES